MRTRWHRKPRTRRDLFFELFDGDVVFFDDGGDGGSGDGDGDDDGAGGDGAQGGDGDGSQGDGDGAQGGDGDDKGTLSAEDARKLRSESRNLRQRLKDAEKKLSDREREDLNEQERLRKDLETKGARADELETEVRDLRVRVLATEVGIRPKAAQAAAALIDWNDVDADDEKVVRDALRDLKKEHDYLFEAKKDADGGKRDRGGSGGGGSGGGEGDSRPGIGRLRRAYSET